MVIGTTKGRHNIEIDKERLEQVNKLNSKGTMENEINKSIEEK